MRARYGFTPRRACELDGSKHTSGAKAFAHAPPVGGDLGCGSDEGRRRLSCSAGARPLRWQSSGQRWRDGPRRFDGDARRKHAHGQSRRSATLTLLDVPLHVWRGEVLVRTRSAVQTGATNNVARSSEGQAFTTGMNAWPGLSRLVQVPTWRPGYYIAANADDYFRPSHRRSLLQCCRRLATPSLVAFATDQIYRSLQGRVTTATPMPEALDFMGGLTIKPS